MRNDLRYGMRKLMQTPGFAILVIIVLALGIGANATIFSLVDAALIRPLGYADPDRLVAVYEGIPAAGLSEIPFSAPDYVAFAHENQVFEAVGGFQNADYELSGVDRPQRVKGARVTASLLPTLGMQPALGRGFTEEEDRSAAPVALISYGLWQRSFGGQHDILGRKLLLDRQPYEVVGVMPLGLEFPPRGPESSSEPAEVYVPMSYTPSELAKYGARFATSAVGRLRPGVTLEQARMDGSRLAQRLLEFYPPALRHGRFALSVQMEPLRDSVIGKSRTLLEVLLAAVAMVLLIACADIANLMLMRTAARQKEFAVRAALGASRWQLARQVLTESGMLAAAGAALGIALTYATLPLLAKTSLELPRLSEARVDGTVLAFTAAAALVTTIVSGLAPAFSLLRSPAGEALQEAGRGGSMGQRQSRLLGGFVVAQFALALVLLAGAGLLLRSFERIIHTDPGFRPEQALALTLSLPSTTYQGASDVRSFYQRLEERASQVPGVRAVAESNATPLQMARRVTFTVDAPEQSADSAKPTASLEYVSGNYLSALGIPLLSGRALSEQDGPETEPVVMVNTTLARRFYPGGAVGHRIKLGLRGGTGWMRIVGVVGDAKQGPLNEETQPAMYQPMAQVSDATVADPLAGGARTRYLIVRTQGEPSAVVPSLEAVVRELDPALAIGKVETFTSLVHDSSAPQRFQAVLVGGFASAALLLAALGVGGVLSYATARRTHEIGVRAALGAQRRDVVRLVMTSGLRLAGAGMAVGLAIALIATRGMAALLYKVSPRDPETMAAVCALLGAVAFVAILIPARRALRVDPIQALRHE